MIPPRACLRSCSIGASSLFIPASQRRVRDNPDSCIWHGVTHGSFLFGHCQVCGDCQVCVLAGLPQGTLGSAGVRTSLNMTRGQSLPRFSGLLVFSLILRTLNFLLLTLKRNHGVAPYSRHGHFFIGRHQSHKLPLQALVKAHESLIRDNRCAKWGPQHPDAATHAPAAPAKGQAPQDNTPLLIPPLNQLAQMAAARALMENAENAQEGSHDKGNHARMAPSQRRAHERRTASPSKKKPPPAS